jgi:cell division septation protein DedD
VPDAFVRNFSEGAKIQVGAYDNEIEARAKVESLRQQGISAEIKQP